MNFSQYKFVLEFEKYNMLNAMNGTVKNYAVGLYVKLYTFHGHTINFKLLSNDFWNNCLLLVLKKEVNTKFE